MNGGGGCEGGGSWKFGRNLRWSVKYAPRGAGVSRNGGGTITSISGCGLPGNRGFWSSGGRAGTEGGAPAPAEATFSLGGGTFNGGGKLTFGMPGMFRGGGRNGPTPPLPGGGIPGRCGRPRKGKPP